MSGVVIAMPGVELPEAPKRPHFKTRALINARRISSAFRLLDDLSHDLSDFADYAGGPKMKLRVARQRIAAFEDMIDLLQGD